MVSLLSYLDSPWASICCMGPMFLPSWITMMHIEGQPGLMHPTCVMNMSYLSYHLLSLWELCALWYVKILFTYLVDIQISFNGFRFFPHSDFVSIRLFIDNFTSQSSVKAQKCYFDDPSMLIVICFIPEVNVIIRNLILKRNSVQLLMYSKYFFYKMTWI